MNEQERKVLPRHAAYLRELFVSGKLSFAGQAFDPKGLWGIIVVNTADAAEAETILKADPSIQAGVMRGEVIPFNTVFPPPAPPASPSAK